MKLREDYLIIINSKNRIQRIRLQLDQNPFTKVFSIFRMTGQFGGKETDQPVIQIDKGKVKRTAAEQATLQYNALLKNYLDKGYVKLSALTTKEYSELKEDEMLKLLGGGFASDQAGVPKPMLAKSSDKCSANIWEKEWLISRKLDGVRMLLYYKDGLIQTASRGGGNYNVATKHIREHPVIKQLFLNNPELILDGELYKHSSEWPLQRISGTARLQEWKEECRELEYWVYDYIDLKQPFKDRLKVLNELRTFFTDVDPIKIIEHTPLTSYLNIKKEHDKYVQEGFEGLCARNPEKEYGVGKRSAIYLVKLKEYKDDEFEVTGIRTGLREEDLCFTLKTKEGKEFAAKPMGDVETRKFYLANWQQFVGRFATCKFFYYSQDRVPLQPILKHFRPIDE